MTKANATKTREVVARSIQARGAAETARRLGMSVEAAVRLGGGFSVRPGTEALAEQRIEQLEGDPPKAAS